MEKPIAEFPDRLIKLNYSLHAKERLQERTTGSLILAPQYVRLTWDNTIERRIKKKRVVEATMVLEYKKGVNMYLPIIVNSGIVKTVFFRNVKKNKVRKGYEQWAKQKSNIFIQDPQANVPDYYTKENIQTQDPITIRTGEEGFRAYVEDVSGDLGRKENWWQKLLRTFRGKNLWRM